MKSRLIGPPEKLFRVGRWPDPLAFPEAPRPLGIPSEPQTGGYRYDDPYGLYSTIYLASSAETAFGETIAAYRPRPEVLKDIDSFVQGETDHGFDPVVTPGEIPPDYFDDRVVGAVPLEDDAVFVDMAHPETHNALDHALPGLLHPHGLSRFDRGVVLSPDRRLTRPISRHYYELAQTPDHQHIVGLRYESRLHDGWECWVIWPPSPLRSLSADPLVPVTRANADLIAAAGKLGIGIPS